MRNGAPLSPNSIAIEANHASGSLRFFAIPFTSAIGEVSSMLTKWPPTSTTRHLSQSDWAESCSSDNPSSMSATS